MISPFDLSSSRAPRVGRLARRCLAALYLVALTSASLPACGGGGGQATSTPASARKWPAAPDLKVKLVVKADAKEAEPFVANVKATLGAVFTTAGYSMVEKEDEAQVVAKVGLTAVEEKAFFKVMVDGKEQTSFKVTVSASFVATSDTAVVDAATVEFVGADGQADEGALADLVMQVSTSGKLAAHAQALQDKVQAEKDKVAQAEEDLWKAANVEGCREPKTDTACDGVKAYLKEYPSGTHAAAGRQAMEDSKVKLAELEDDKAWEAADAEACKKPQSVDACKGVEKYLKKYPAGLHKDEAKSALKAAEAPLAQLQKKADAEKKKKNYAQCVKGCRRQYETYRAFQTLVQRCIQTECM